MIFQEPNESAQKDLNTYKNLKSLALQKMGDFRVIEGKNGFGAIVWREGCYETPGYFMQGLADLAATQNIHEMAKKYTKARNDFVIVYLSGMTHPHMVQSYYLLINFPELDTGFDYVCHNCQPVPSDWIIWYWDDIICTSNCNNCGIMYGSYLKFFYNYYSHKSTKAYSQ